MSSDWHPFCYTYKRGAMVNGYESLKTLREKKIASCVL